MTLRERLEELGERVPGFVSIALVAEDGILVETAGDRERIDLEAMVAELLTHIKVFSHERRGLGVGHVERMSISTDSFTVVTNVLDEEHFLVAVLDNAVGHGRARFELRRAGVLFAEEF